jgi:hypothetical protein
MGFFTTRSERISVEFPTHVHFQKKENDTISANCHQGTIIKISKTGACVVVDKVVLDGQHLFFHAQEQAENWLYLNNFPVEIDEENEHLTAEAIWMDTCTFKNRSAFKIGIRFTQENNKLFHFLKENQKTYSSEGSNGE